MTSLILRQIALENFKSFKGQHTFDLNRTPTGLYFITGDNRDEPSLGANGAGKSTVFDALYAALYGKTPRGLKAANVKTWAAAGVTRVDVFLTINDADVIIRRQWGPNKLSVERDGNKEIVTDKDIIKLIGLTAEAFKNTLLISQFGQTFFDLQPAAKLTLFTDVLNLDSWLRLSATAANKVKILTANIGNTQSALDRDLGRMEELQNRWVQEEGNVQRFETEREARITSTLKNVEGGKKDLPEYEQRIIKHEDKRGTLLSKYDAAIAKVDALVQKQGSIGDKLTKIDLDFAVLEQKQYTILDELESLNDLEAICPVCNQPVDTKNLQAHSTRILEDLDKVKTELGQLETKATELRRKHTYLDGRIEKNESIIRDTEKEINDSNRVISALELEITKYKTLLEVAEQQVQELKDAPNTAAEQLEALDKTIQETQTSIKTRAVKLKELTGNKEAYAYWVQAYKQIRLSVVEHALTDLELSINNNLMQLGLDNWTISFDVERETKSGGISKGFTVMVFGPNNKEAVPWEAWSGGETQRLRLAGVMGLADLIMAYSGLQSNIEVYDEPSQHLSTTGITDILNLLTVRASNRSINIFLIDHRSLDYGDFAGTIKIVKDASGSRIL